MKQIKRLLATTAMVVLSAATAQAADVKLRIMETTDIHVHIADYDYYKDAESATLGLARTATLIKQAREEVTNSLLFDNGDLIQGNPLGDYIAKERGLHDGDVHPVYKAMNLLDYDAGNLGNHEFNYGLEFLEKSLSGAGFPYVSANTYKYDGDDDSSNDVNFFKPYLILDREVKDLEGKVHKIKVGVIGFLPPQIVQWDKVNLEGKLITHDIVEDAEKFIPLMKKEGADIIVAIPHSGIGNMEGGKMAENATYELSKVEGIDAILFGHSHLPFPGEKFADLKGADIEMGTINGVPSVMPGYWGSHLGVVDLELQVNDDKWTVASGKGSVRGIYKRDGRKKIPLVEASPEINAAIKTEHEETVEFMRKGVGQTSAPIHSYFALVQDDPSVQIVTNSQKRYVEKLIQGTEYDGIPVLSAGAPFKAGGRGGAEYYTNIPTGEIALKNVADLYIYPNTLRAVLIKGSDVREWLEMSAGAFNQIKSGQQEEQLLLNPAFPSYNFDIIDGVTFQIDLSKPARYNKEGEMVNDDHRIIDLAFEGKAIDMNKNFIVATNNYRAGGGGNFPALDGSNVIIEAPDENRTVLANYIFDLKNIDPSADKNWSFKSVVDSKVIFETSPSAQAALSNDMNIKYVGNGTDGFAKYRMILE